MKRIFGPLIGQLIMLFYGPMLIASMNYPQPLWKSLGRDLRIAILAYAAVVGVLLAILIVLEWQGISQ